MTYIYTKGDAFCSHRGTYTSLPLFASYQAGRDCCQAKDMYGSIAAIYMAIQPWSLLLGVIDNKFHNNSRKNNDDNLYLMIIHLIYYVEKQLLPWQTI
mgnify:CR=1 FL=1